MSWKEWIFQTRISTCFTLISAGEKGLNHLDRDSVDAGKWHFWNGSPGAEKLSTNNPTKFPRKNPMAFLLAWLANAVRFQVFRLPRPFLRHREAALFFEHLILPFYIDTKSSSRRLSGLFKKVFQHTITPFQRPVQSPGGRTMDSPATRIFSPSRQLTRTDFIR